jgi:hypothetical protein
MMDFMIKLLAQLMKPCAIIIVTAYWEEESAAELGFGNASHAL